MKRHPYAGLPVALGTMHGKERALAPVLSRTPGLRLVRAPIDTDRLGTFTGEIERPGSARETAVHKARLGMQATGMTRGLASEGAYGPHPDSPFVLMGIEILTLLDDDLGIEVTETLRTRRTFLEHVTIGADRAGLASFLVRIGFGSQGLVVRPADGDLPAQIDKGIRTRGALEEAIDRCLAVARTGQVRVETDMRAHHNPARMAEIAELGHLLGQRLATLCPTCAAPGFGLVSESTGLPCVWCGIPTLHVLARTFGCARCEHRCLRRAAADAAPPGDCPACNP